MNIVVKSSIVALLAAATSSVVNADCIRDGNNAAELIISQHWCSSPFPRGIPASDEGCREVAIQTCQSEDTFRNIINEWGCRQPGAGDIRDLGDKCEDTVNHLIGITWPDLDDESSTFVSAESAKGKSPHMLKLPLKCGSANTLNSCMKRGNCRWSGGKCINKKSDQSEAEVSFVSTASMFHWQPTPTREECNRDEMCTWCDDMPEFFQYRFDLCVKEQIHRDCLSWAGCCGGSLRGTACGFAEEASFVALDSSDTSSAYRLEDYEASFISKASKTQKPTRSPTRSPTSNSSVASGFKAGQQALQQWWKDEGSTCSNAWSGIINPVGNEIKNSQFPNKGSSTRRARNQGARLGVDSEVRAIQEECFSAKDMDDAEEANEASFVSVERSGFPFPDPPPFPDRPRPWEICYTLRTKEECESEDWCTWKEFEFEGVAVGGSCW